MSAVLVAGSDICWETGGVADCFDESGFIPKQKHKNGWQLFMSAFKVRAGYHFSTCVK